MPNLAGLKAEIVTDPLTRGYAGMSNEAIADSLNTADRLASIKDVSLGDLNREIDNMLDANNVRVWNLIEVGAEQPTASPFREACRAALSLLQNSRPDYPGVNTRSPLFVGQVDALQAGGAFTEGQATALKSMSDVYQSRAQERRLGYIDASGVARARALP